MIPWIDPINPSFPPVAQALTEPDGLLCAGGNLKPETLVRAYSAGLFPWFNEGEPILWWSPDPRMILVPTELHLSRSLKKQLRSTPFTLTINHCFDEVITQCAAPRSYTPETWISETMRSAYSQLHRLGHAHSIEVWLQERLVGGLYGVFLGETFFGESMFSSTTNASKAALLGLQHWLEPLEQPLIDCQLYSAHLASMGARLIPRSQFCQHLSRTHRHSALGSQRPQHPATDFHIDTRSLLALSSTL